MNAGLGLAFLIESMRNTEDEGAKAAKRSPRAVQSTYTIEPPLECRAENTRAESIVNVVFAHASMVSNRFKSRSFSPPGTCCHPGRLPCGSVICPTVGSPCG